MFCRKNRAHIFAFAVLACQIASAASEGWTGGNPGRAMATPEKEIWSAPFGKGMNAFRVDWRDGATGRVSVADSALRIEKTNADGMVVVTAAEKINVDPGRIVQGYVAFYDESPSDPHETKAFIRLWSGKENLGWNRKHFGGATTEAPVYNDFINTPPGCFTRKLCRTEAGPVGKVTAAIMVSGNPSVSVWRDWGVEDADAADMKWTREKKTPLEPPDRSGTMIAEALFDAGIAADTEHSARMAKTSNGGVLEVDGRAVPPIFFKPTPFGHGVPFTGEGAMFEKSGVNLHTVNIRLGVGFGRIGFWSKDGFDCAGAVKRVKDFMRSAPKSLFLLTIRCDAYPEYADEHPGHAWVTAKGTPVWGSCSSGYAMKGKPKPHTWPWISNHSSIWRNDVKKLMSQLVGELKRTGLSKRIIGVHLAGYHDGQFAARETDFSTAAVEAFHVWQKEVYGRIRWKSAPEFTKSAYLDPVREEAHVAYQNFLKIGPMRMQEDFARHLKKEFGKPIIVGRWCMNPFGGTIMATLDFTPFVNSGAMDFLVAQPRYQRRAPGLDCAYRIPLESFRLHGKMFLNEFDLRTWHGRGPDVEARSTYLSCAEDQAMWETVHRKLAGQMFAQRVGWWYFDMTDNWFGEGGIQREIASVRKTAEKYYAAKPSSWHPDVAVIIDEDGLYLVNRVGVAFSVRERKNTSEQHMVLSAAGVPYDIILADDILRDPSIADRYKAFLVTGFYNIDAPRRKFIERAKARGAKFVFAADAGICGGADACGKGEVLEEPCGLTAKMFNAFARSAGAYVPCDMGLQVDMNGEFVSVHCLRTGRYDFTLPHEAEVTNLKTGRNLGTMRSIPLDMTGGETRWYGINPNKKGTTR